MRRPTTLPFRQGSGGIHQLAAWCLVLAATICLLTLPVTAQTGSTGSIAGVVSDPSGAVVPAATVTITDRSTGTKRTTTTTDTGRYVFPNVDPGVYDVSITKQGFANTTIAAQNVRVGQVL